VNAVHLHLVLNHVPVIGAAIGVVLLAIAFGRRSDDLARTTLGLFVVLAATAGVVFLTGEPAEESVERLAGTSESLVEAHERAALGATVLMGIAGAAALAALVAFRRSSLPRSVVSAGLLIALTVSGAMAWTANLGGRIRHPEIREGTAGQATDGPVGVAPDARQEAGEAAERGDNDDDDVDRVPREGSGGR
jgi:hypothetical protein